MKSQEPSEPQVHVNAPTRRRTRNVNALLAFSFGASFITVLLILALCVPSPTPFQYTVFRVILSLAAAGVAAVIPGFLELDVTPHARFAIRAGGALAVFIVVYFLNPARLAGPPPGRTAIVPFIEHEDVHLGDNVYPPQWGFSHNPLNLSIYPQSAPGIVYYDKKNRTFLAGTEKQTIIGQMLVQHLSPLISEIDFTGYEYVCAHQGQAPPPKELQTLIDKGMSDRYVQIDPMTVLFATHSSNGDFYDRYAAVGIVRAVNFSMPLARLGMIFTRSTIQEVELLLECYHGGIRPGQSGNFLALVNGQPYAIGTTTEHAREKEVVSVRIDPNDLQYQAENIIAVVVLPWVEERPKSFSSNKGPAHFRDVGVVNSFLKVTEAANNAVHGRIASSPP